MQDIWQNYKLVFVALAIALIAFLFSAFVVPEEEQVVIVRTGEPKYVINTPGGTTGAGLYLRVPLIDRVVRIEKRLLDLTMTDEEVLSNDQQRLLVNSALPTLSGWSNARALPTGCAPPCSRSSIRC